MKEQTTKAKKRVLQGMRPTGKLHLGNYLGTAKGMLLLQEDPQYETYYMVADLHGITTPFDPQKIHSDTKSVVLDYLSVGLDPDKSAIFVQSDLADLHAQLAFYFSSVVTVARMRHLPTFKEKVKQHPENTTMALLNYPVLMAADILIYKASMVPVGLDQEPHLEVSREIARKMNEMYGTDFPEPQRLKSKGEYVPSLLGEGKMSKSIEGSYISLTDDLESIRNKLSSAPTDSGKGGEVPKEGGVANLLKLVELFEGEDKRKLYEEKYKGNGIKYRDLKEELSQAIFGELKPIQDKRKIYEEDSLLVERILEKGAEKARQVASQTVREVREKMGLV